MRTNEVVLCTTCGSECYWRTGCASWVCRRCGDHQHTDRCKKCGWVEPSIESWVKSDGEPCPICNGVTEFCIVGAYHVAERCPSCRWQVNFFPETKGVLFGSKVESLTDTPEGNK